MCWQSKLKVTFPQSELIKIILFIYKFLHRMISSVYLFNVKHQQRKPMEISRLAERLSSPLNLT